MPTQEDFFKELTNVSKMTLYDLMQILNAANSNKTVEFKFGSIPTEQTEEVYIPPVLILTNRIKDIEFTITMQLDGAFKAA